MHDQPAHQAPEDGIQQPASSSLGGSFLSARHYPEESIAAGPPPAASAPESPGPASRRWLTRVVLPLLIFIVAIGTLAWITQYLPGRGEDPERQGNLNTGKKAQQVIKFTEETAAWEFAKDKDGKFTPTLYAAEFEILGSGRQDGGHRDFEFFNDSSAPAEVGVQHMSCQCSSVRACVLDEAQWKSYQDHKAQRKNYREDKQSYDLIALARDEGPAGLAWKELKKGEGSLVVPAGARGLVRLSWDGRKQEPGALRVDVTVWSEPQGKNNERTYSNVSTVVSYVRPAQCLPEKIDIGALAPRSKTPPMQFVCWSASRKDLQLEVMEKDPCFEFRREGPLNEAGCAALTAKLRAEGTWTQVKSAWRVWVIVHEQKDDKQLDLGTILRTIPLQVKSDGDNLVVASPVLHGSVQGDVQVGSVDDQNRIRLGNFRSTLGTKKTVRVKTGSGVRLTHKEQDFAPPVLNLKVTLTPQPKDATPDSAVWNLQVEVPAGIPPGTLPEDSAVLLRMHLPGGGERTLRVPILGVALGG